MVDLGEVIPGLEDVWLSGPVEEAEFDVDDAWGGGEMEGLCEGGGGVWEGDGCIG